MNAAPLRPSAPSHVDELELPELVDLQRVWLRRESDARAECRRAREMVIAIDAQITAKRGGK